MPAWANYRSDRHVYFVFLVQNSHSFIMFRALSDLTFYEIKSLEATKGKQFEVFCNRFLENDPEWSKTAEHQPVIY